MSWTDQQPGCRCGNEQRQEAERMLDGLADLAQAIAADMGNWVSAISAIRNDATRRSLLTAAGREEAIITTPRELERCRRALEGHLELERLLAEEVPRDE